MDAPTLDARTGKIIATLDPKAQAAFRLFMAVAKEEAASFGCDYVLICGNRTFAEQDALYAQGRTKPGKVVTKAPGGYSNHNFGIAADAGVFADGVYLDEKNPRLAERVHRACAAHARAFGLEWGGEWTSFPDTPHYEIRTGLTMSRKRELWAARGSVL